MTSAGVKISGTFEVVAFEEAHRAQVIALWESCGLTRPWNDPDKDIDRKLSEKTGRLFVALNEGGVIGSVMVGYDGHRGSIYYLAVHPDHQSVGLGRALMTNCEEFLLELGCPKINLLVRRGNEKVLAFYDRLGFTQDDVVSLGKRLIPDD